MPLRGYLESVGGKVTWQPPNQIAVTLEDRTYLFEAGSAAVQTEGGTLFMETPAQIINGHTYIHVRFLEQGLGARFTFDGRSVRVTKPSAGQIVVIDGPLNVRQSPSTTAPILYTFPVGTTLEVIQTQGEWTQVQLPRGSTGWLANQFTRPTVPSPELGAYGDALRRGYAYAEAGGSCMGQAPIVGDKLYIPLRETVRRLGGQTAWENNAAVVRLGGRTLTLVPNRAGAELDGLPYPLEASILIDGQMLVPARSFADALGLSLQWDEVRKTARILGGTASSGSLPCNPDAPLQAYIIMDRATGQVLAEYQAERPMQVASTTKMMTALLAIERGQPESIVTVSQRASRMIGASLGLVSGERMRLDDMLVGMMLRSGNDAAAAVAEHLGGTEANFALMMTARAVELGARNTLFLNASGLDDDERPVSTAADLALMARHALHSNEFRALASRQTAVVPGPNGARSITNSNDFVGAYPGATGVKNGWTELADHTLVASAYRDGREIIVVALGAASRAQIYSQTGRLMDIGFALAEASWVLESIGK